uniref:Uncharacterized protein n=1 Tax=Oreochromis aureus TaxID=47969 RepID=A0AAZ1X1T1_OREAU
IIFSQSSLCYNNTKLLSYTTVRLFEDFALFQDHLNECSWSWPLCTFWIKLHLQTSTEDERLRSTAATVMGIYTITREGIQEPEDVGVVIEGTTVMNSLGSVIMAFIVFFGLIYALDLSYPNDHKYTLEFCQNF